MKHIPLVLSSLALMAALAALVASSAPVVGQGTPTIGLSGKITSLIGQPVIDASQVGGCASAADCGDAHSAMSLEDSLQALGTLTQPWAKVGATEKVPPAALASGALDGQCATVDGTSWTFTPCAKSWAVSGSTEKVPISELITGTPTDGQCLKTTGGALALGDCESPLVTGSVTVWGALSPDRTVDASDFTGTYGVSATVDYTSAGTFRVTLPAPTTPTDAAAWGYDPVANGVYCSSGGICGYRALAFPTPPGRPYSEATFGNPAVDRLFFTQGTISLQGETVTVLVSKTVSFLNFARSDSYQWDRWTGTALADIADPGPPTPIPAHQQPPASAATMFGGWVVCPTISSTCALNVRQADPTVKRFDSGDTVQLADATGMLRWVIAYQCTADSAAACRTDTTNRPTSIRQGTPEEMISHYRDLSNVTGPFPGWTTRIKYLVGPLASDPTGVNPLTITQ